MTVNFPVCPYSLTNFLRQYIRVSLRIKSLHLITVLSKPNGTSHDVDLKLEQLLQLLETLKSTQGLWRKEVTTLVGLTLLLECFKMKWCLEKDCRHWYTEFITKELLPPKDNIFPEGLLCNSMMLCGIRKYLFSAKSSFSCCQQGKMWLVFAYLELSASSCWQKYTVVVLLHLCLVPCTQ